MAWGPGYPGVRGVLVCTSSQLGWPTAVPDHPRTEVGTGGLGPAQERGASCLWSHGRRALDSGSKKALRPELPRDPWARSPAAGPHVHTSRVKLTSGAQAPQSRL